MLNAIKIRLPINKSKLLPGAKKIFPFLLIIGVIIFAYSIRSQTFWTSHWKGDEAHYLSLAMKLDKFGLSQYSIRGINVRFYQLGSDSTVRLAFPSPALDNDQGDILKALIIVGSSYYDQPLYQNAFGFPLALALSHRMFAKNNQPYTAVLIRIPALNAYFARVSRPPSLITAQFYAAIVPLFFSLLTVTALFILGSILFSYRAGLYAAFLYAIHPVSLLASQRIWADEMLTAFTVIAAALLVVSFKKQKTWISFLAGISLGAAILAKQSGLIIAPVLWIFTMMMHRKKFNKLNAIPFAIFNKHFILLVLGALLTSGPWFWMVRHTYGTPLFRPVASNISRDVSGWFRLLNEQPHPYIIFTVGAAFICPLTIFCLLSLKQWFQEIKAVLLASEERATFTLLWGWVLWFFYISANYLGKEHRYMLPAYAAVALLAGYGLEQVWQFFTRKLAGRRIIKFIPEIVIIALLCTNAWWSIPIGNEAVLENKLLILKPFEPDLKKNPNLHHELSQLPTVRTILDG